MVDKIDKFVRQTHRYYYDDGLVEMIIGLLFVATGLVLLVWQALGFSTLATIALSLGLAGAVIGLAILAKSGVQKLKERITFPRTGYVSYHRDRPSRGRWLVVLASLILAIFLLFMPEPLTRMPSVVGAWLAVVLGYLGYRVGLRRFYLLAIASLVVGVAAAGLVDNEVIGTALCFVIVGLLLAFAGALALAFYLRHHPEPNEIVHE